MSKAKSEWNGNREIKLGFTNSANPGGSVTRTVEERNGVQRGLLAAQAVCPGCNLKRAPREFGGYKKCGTCRARKR